MKMEYLKKRLVPGFIFMCILTVPVSLHAGGGENSLSASLSWDLYLRACYEYRFEGALSVRAGVGTRLLLPGFPSDGTMMLSQEALAVINFSNLYEPFQYGIGAGIPVSGMMWYADEETSERFFRIMFAPGCSGYLGYRSPRGISYRIWFGAGYPFIYDAGRWHSGATLPLGLWWDMDLEVVFPVR